MKVSIGVLIGVILGCCVSWLFVDFDRSPVVDDDRLPSVVVRDEAAQTAYEEHVFQAMCAIVTADGPVLLSSASTVSRAQRLVDAFDEWKAKQ